MPFGPSEKDALITAVRQTARAEIMPRFRRLDPSQIAAKSAPDDLVTLADHATEVVLTAAINRIMPDASVVGEEAVAADPTVLAQIDSGLCVVIDPIDGTWNFANGLSVFGVIVAIVENGQTLWGMLYDPVHDDWVEAAPRQGAWFHAQGVSPVRLNMGPARPADEAIGLIVMSQFSQSDQLGLAQMLPQFHRVTNLMCSCHEYRLLAQGGVDFCLNAHLNPWDHAAGALIVREAGGVARLLDGSDYMPTQRAGRLLLARSEAAWANLADNFGFID